MLSKDLIMQEEDLESIVENQKPLIGKQHPVYKIESNEKYDLSQKSMPELYMDGRVIGNEKYIQVK